MDNFTVCILGDSHAIYNSYRSCISEELQKLPENATIIIQNRSGIDSHVLNIAQGLSESKNFKIYIYNRTWNIFNRYAQIFKDFHINLVLIFHWDPSDKKYKFVRKKCNSTNIVLREVFPKKYDSPYLNLTEA